MRGVVASVTSCIGGKDERYAVKVTPPQCEPYFIYKTMTEFEAMWAKMEAIAAEAKLKQQLFVDDGASQDVSVLAKWLMSFIDHFAFRTTIEQLRDECKETITPLNVLVQALVRRVSALYVESTILRCGCCQVGRQLALLVRQFLDISARVDTTKPTRHQLTIIKPVFESSPRQRKRHQSEVFDNEPTQEETRQQSPVGTSPMFPVRTYEPSPKTRKVSPAVASSEDFMIHKVALNAPAVPALAGRRRVYAEVDFGL